MVVEIPFGVIAAIILKFGTLPVQRIGAAIGVAKQLNELKLNLDIMNGLLVDAEEKQVENHAVQAWLRMVKDVAYDIDDLLDQFEIHQLQGGGVVARKVSAFLSSNNQYVFSFKMSGKVKKIKKKVDRIVKQIPGMLNRIQCRRELERSLRETHSSVFTPNIVGRKQDKKEMIERLVSVDNEETFSMAAIVGIGGMGKTTLAQLVYNDPIVVEYFELKIWVYVSDLFDVKLIAKNILQSVSKVNAENLNLQGLKINLHEELREKRCLVVLDDVWNDDVQKWDQLKSLLMTVKKGSKFLVTTRNDRVASVMGIRSPLILESLDENQSWDLFAEIAFPNGLFLEIGKEVVSKCKGVPLLIKTLATILSSKTKQSEWLSIRDSKNLLSIGGQNRCALSILKISYNNLPTYLKQCFTYCALFPKNYKFDKKSLVQMWIAQGYIQPLDEDLGEYFEELLSRSMFEVFEKDAYDNILSYTMHDVFHDLACTVMGSEVLILEDNMREISSQVRHVSFFKSMNLKWKALKVKQVRTFLSFPLSYNYKDDLIQRIEPLNFKRLRVLSLNGCKRQRLGISLEKLCHLRYLDLSYNDLEKLPESITKLKCLQTLRVVGCENPKEFREDTRKLISLRHLENHGCPRLSHMPCGIGKLTMLRSLPVFVIGNGKKVGRLSELKWLYGLRGELSIVNLENVNVRGGAAAELESGEANLRAKQHIQFLRLEWGKRDGEAMWDESDESVLEGLHPPPNLEGLCIKGYAGCRFPNWMSASSLCNLAAVNLDGCSRCQTLPCFVRFRFLKYMELSDLEKVDYIVVDHHSSNDTILFSALRKLSLDGMQKLKGLWRMDSPTNHRPPSFPHLSQLKLSHCPDLASLPLPPTPLLSQLEIGCCDRLASLELHSCPCLSKLQIYECPSLTSLLLPPSPLLSHLEIRSCCRLASFRLHSSPCLSVLRISFCLNLRFLLFPPTHILSSLKIEHCPELTSVQLS